MGLWCFSFPKWCFPFPRCLQKCSPGWRSRSKTTFVEDKRQRSFAKPIESRKNVKNARMQEKHGNCRKDKNFERKSSKRDEFSRNRNNTIPKGWKENKRWEMKLWKKHLTKASYFRAPSSSRKLVFFSPRKSQKGFHFGFFLAANSTHVFQVLLLLTYKMPCASVSFPVETETIRWLICQVWSPVGGWASLA